MKEPECGRAGCDDQGIWQAMFKIRPLGDPPSSTRTMMAEVGLVACEAHKDATVLEDLLSPEGWVAITKGIRSVSRAAPDPDVILEWREVPICNFKLDDDGNKCPDRIVENIVLTYLQPAPATPIHVQLKACSLHLPDINRLLIEELHPDGVQHLPLGGSKTGYDVVIPPEAT